MIPIECETIESHIVKEQLFHPQARGDFSALLRRIALGVKFIEVRVQKAGLLEVLGNVGSHNVQGEEQQKLDVLANITMQAIFQGVGYAAAVASEEEDDFVLIPKGLAEGRYIVAFDPLDGSSNIDANVSIGTIFSIYRRVTVTGQPTLEDFLQPGLNQVAAGYAIYGSSTMFVYTAGNGVHGFTLDREFGEFILSNPNIKLPEICRVFSANDMNYPLWDEPTRQFVDHLRRRQEKRYEKTTSRYIGSMVADVHRNLLYGGIFLYPSDKKNKNGKLRLLFEANPMAFLIEQAGGAATDGLRRILEIKPDSLHQRVPVILGNKEEVELYKKYAMGEHPSPKS